MNQKILFIVRRYSISSHTYIQKTFLFMKNTELKRGEIIYKFLTM